MQATIAVEARLASNKSGTSNVAALKAMYGEFFTVDTSNRVPLPFSGAFSCFRFRAFLLFLLLPCASAVLMAVVLVSWASGWLETADVLGGLDADADNEAMGIEWAILDVPSSFAIQLLLARLVWQLHSVNRAGGPYETLSQNSVPKAWTRRLRIVMGAFFVLWAAWLALRVSQEVRRNETEEEETRWLTVLRTTRFWLLLVSFPAIVLSVCQMSAAVAAVVVELSDLTLLIKTCEQSIWESAVIEAAKNVVHHLLPTLKRGWSRGCAEIFMMDGYLFVLQLVRFSINPEWSYLAFASVFLVAGLALLALPLQIEIGCKKVERALMARALGALATSPVAADPAIKLCFVLSNGEHWGFKLIGVRVTARVMGRVAGGAVTLLTLMAKFADDKCAQLEE